MHSSIRAELYASKVRTLFPVLGLIVEMAMINDFVSLRVPEVALAYAKPRVNRVAQVHVLPRHPIDRIETAAVQESIDGSHQSPRRQSLNEG